MFRYCLQFKYCWSGNWPYFCLILPFLQEAFCEAKTVADPGFSRQGRGWAGANPWLWGKILPIITARKRSLEQGNVFRNVCQSFCPQGERGLPNPTPPPRCRHYLDAPHMGYYEIRLTNGRYASYWNAFLFGKIFAENCMKMKEIGSGGGSLAPPLKLLMIKGNIRVTVMCCKQCVVFNSRFFIYFRIFELIDFILVDRYCCSALA